MMKNSAITMNNQRINYNHEPQIESYLRFSDLRALPRVQVDGQQKGSSAHT